MYGSDEVQSAFERMTVKAIEDMGIEPADAVRDPKFALRVLEGCGIDLESVSEWLHEMVPPMVEMLIMASIGAKDDRQDVGGGMMQATLTKDDIEAIAGTILLRGMGLGIMLENPTVGENPMIMGVLNGMSFSREEAAEILNGYEGPAS